MIQKSFHETDGCISIIKYLTQAHCSSKCGKYFQWQIDISDCELQAQLWWSAGWWCVCVFRLYPVSAKLYETLNFDICIIIIGCFVLRRGIFLDALAQRECRDLRGRQVSHGIHYVPGPDTCTLCVCEDGVPTECKAVLCSPPQVLIRLKNDIFTVFVIDQNFKFMCTFFTKIHSRFYCWDKQQLHLSIMLLTIFLLLASFTFINISIHAFMARYKQVFLTSIWPR